VTVFSLPLKSGLERCVLDGGIYLDTDKVTVQGCRPLKNAVETELTGEQGHDA
jgi:hypothetical protein